jgi:hypothetical protein
MQTSAQAVGIIPPFPAATGPSILPADVDRIAELKRLDEKHKPIAAELKTLKEKIESACESYPADREFVAQGNLYELRIGMRKKERPIVNKGRLKRILTRLKLFEEAWDVSLGFIDKHVQKSDHKLFLIEERTGHRELKPVLKEAAKAA